MSIKIDIPIDKIKKRYIKPVVKFENNEYKLDYVLISDTLKNLDRKNCKRIKAEDL